MKHWQTGLQSPSPTNLSMSPGPKPGLSQTTASQTTLLLDYIPRLTKSCITQARQTQITAHVILLVTQLFLPICIIPNSRWPPRACFILCTQLRC